MSNDNTEFSHLHVTFYADKVENRSKTKEEGRPIFDDIEMVKIQIAGDTKSIIVAPAHGPSSSYDRDTGHRLTYAELHEGPYQAFKKKVAFTGSGTPLSELTFITEAKRAELNAVNVHTAEALADLDGANLKRLGMGARELKDQAKLYLETASGQASTNAMAKQIADLEAKLAVLQGGKDEQTAQPDTVTPNADSPFADWDKEAIGLWLEEAGAPKPHHLTGLPKLIELADAHNEKLRLEKEAA